MVAVSLSLARMLGPMRLLWILAALSVLTACSVPAIPPT